MKKVLSLVLTAALVLGSFSMAFAADTKTSTSKLSDISTSANSDAIQVANDLGIVTGYPDGTFKPTQSVNRAEFAAMITRALAIPESALSGYKTTTFKDVKGYDWAVKYLGFCESKGIMLGDTTTGSVTLGAKISGKTIKEVYSVVTWKGETPFKFATDMLEKTKLNGYKMPLNDNGEIDETGFTLPGVTALNKIAKDNIVDLYLAKANDTKEKVVRVEVGTETVTGKVTLVSDGDYTIGGKVYSKASNALKTIKLGDTGTAHLNYKGEIADWSVTNAESDNYAMVTGTFDKSGRYNTVILMDKTGTEKE